MTAERLYTLKEASEALGISPLTLRKWIIAGQIVGTKIGKQWRITETDLQDFINKNRQI
jgi:excisionase family DNA binding protein